jgi:N-acetylneuraminic acid mutarotase
MTQAALVLLAAFSAPVQGMSPAEPCQDAGTHLERLPFAIASFGAAALGEHVYVLGGHVGRKHAHSIENLSARFGRFPSSDPGAFEDLPGGTPVQGTALVAVGARVVRIGGLFAANAVGEPEELWSTRECSAYDPETRTWSALPPLPRPRSSHDAAVVGSRIFVVGGWELAGSSRAPSWHDDALVLDLAAPEPCWASLPQPFHRRALALAASESELWVMGGLDDLGDVSTEVEVYDLATESWRSGPELPESGFGAAAATLGERVVVSAGSGTVWRANAEGSGWERFDELAIPRFFHRLVPAGEGRLVAIGGAAGEAHTSWIEYASASPADGPMRVRNAGIACDTEARERQGMVLCGDELLVFGGNGGERERRFESASFVTESWSIDLLSGTASRTADLPQARQSTCTALSPLSSDLAFSVGGLGHDGESERSSADVLAYSFETRRWSTLSARLPSSATQLGLAVHDDILWALGGMEFDPDREPPYEILDQVSRFDPRGPSPSFVEAAFTLPRPRRAFASAAIGREVYVVGGAGPSFSELAADAGKLDLESGGWTPISAPSRPRLMASLVPLAGKLYLFGGSVVESDGSRRADRRLEVYDPATDHWEIAIDELPFATEGARMLAWRGRLLVASTHATDGLLSLHFLVPRADERP